jgi:SAM-dependent methyltransferase
VLNVGAGTGSYEPADRDVTALEPSREMIGQRPPDSAPVIEGVAEELPFEDDSFDAAMALTTVHHWTDLQAGLAEMVRAARQRVVVLTFTPVPPGDLWMRHDYFPRMLDFHTRVMPPIDELTTMLPNASVEPVPIPNGCADGFWLAIWDRPEMHFDPDVRRASSTWHQLPPDEVEHGLAKLRADLESGRWDARNGHLREAPQLDVGLRLVTAELG